MDDHEEAPGPHVPENRGISGSKLRRDCRHCPVCLAALSKNVRRTRLQKNCAACRAHPSLSKHCLRCGGEFIWENKIAAACQGCGLHGTKAQVIVG